jgi:hypothetical protein
MPTTTSLMGLTVPMVNDPTPDYVAAIAASLALLDAHDHTSGKGAQVPAAALNINAPLSFGGFSATGLRSAQFQSLLGALSASIDNNSLSVANGDLYFLDGSNRSVRITTNGRMNASGGFGGDYTTANASATYTSSTRRYTFQDQFAALAGIVCSALLAGTSNSNFGGDTPAVGSLGVSILPGNTGAAQTMLSVQGDIGAQGGFVHSAFSTYQTIAASQTNATMKGLNGVAGGSTNAIGYWVPPRQGSVVGLGWCFSSTQSAGNLTFTVFKNGVATGAVLGPIASGQAVSATFTKDAITFAANDIIDIRYTTNGAFAPTGQDGVICLHVEY